MTCQLYVSFVPWGFGQVAHIERALEANHRKGVEGESGVLIGVARWIQVFSQILMTLTKTRAEKRQDPGLDGGIVLTPRRRLHGFFVFSNFCRTEVNEKPARPRTFGPGKIS